MGKLFGTDGIRGVANRDLTPELAFKIGRITAWLLGGEKKEPLILIGRDTRISGAMLEGALTAGINSAGGEVLLLGIISTPGVAYLTRRLNAAAGVVISASHNPIEHNGLKIFDHRGFKLPDQLEEEIEKYYFQEIDSIPRPEGVMLGRTAEDGETVKLYLDHLKKSGPSLDGYKMVVDCAHGAACRVAGELFSGLGASVKLLHSDPDGSLINVKCGATDTADLQRHVIAEGASIGLALDGDADRLIAVDEKGKLVDGDAIMSICAIDMMSRGRLKGNMLVTTVMSNGGLDILAEKYGFKLLRTVVGDRFVLEKMLEGGYNLGGEQSGHIIFSDYATTGDGLLTALQLLQVLRTSDASLSELASRLERLPQVLVNREVSTKEGWSENARIKEEIGKVEKELGRFGRVLVRPSGTEALIRVMLEAPLPEDRLYSYAHDIADLIAEEQSK